MLFDWDVPSATALGLYTCSMLGIVLRTLETCRPGRVRPSPKWEMLSQAKVVDSGVRLRNGKSLWPSINQGDEIIRSLIGSENYLIRGKITCRCGSLLVACVIGVGRTFAESACTLLQEAFLCEYRNSCCPISILCIFFHQSSAALRLCQLHSGELLPKLATQQVSQSAHVVLKHVW